MKKLSTENAPAAIGPYSQGYKANGFIYTSGQIPIDMKTGELVDDIKMATRVVLDNIRAILKSGGADLDSVIKTTVFLRDMNDFVPMNEVYAEIFGEYAPARSTVQVAMLPKGAIIEIEAIALEK